MRLYPKKLNSVAELKHERAMLRNKLKQYNEEGILPGLSTSKKSTDKKDDKDLLSIIGNFFFSNPFASLAFDLAMPMIKGTGKKAGKSIFSIAKEVAGGYAKWKALEICYRWVRRAIKKRKEKS